ncbi:MAG: Hint domain-containing protein [Candidatus Sungbacteria bacterium]|nr:Hint domain-containing protein [Candidatus Sungbacteria bacterium]
MRTKNNGFVSPILVIIIALLAIISSYLLIKSNHIFEVLEPSGGVESPVPVPVPAPNPNPAPVPPVACTQDAKQCPDGSYVSRTGPKCEFAPCPAPRPVPVPTPSPHSQIIIKKAGEQEGSFLIQKINLDTVEGLWYQQYPVAYGEGVPKTLRIGDDIGYACEGVSEKLVRIDFANQTVTFEKTTGNPPMGGCPRCLAAGMLIDTPNGKIAVENMREGMAVWTSDALGNRVRAVVRAAGKTSVPATHRVAHLVLADGRELFVSPDHPTADARLVKSLKQGDVLDGAVLVKIELLPYDAGYTYDILSSGATGTYWANEILMGSTLLKSQFR